MFSDTLGVCRTCDLVEGTDDDDFVEELLLLLLITVDFCGRLNLSSSEEEVNSSIFCRILRGSFRVSNVPMEMRGLLDCMDFPPVQPTMGPISILVLPSKFVLIELKLVFFCVSRWNSFSSTLIELFSRISVTEELSSGSDGVRSRSSSSSSEEELRDFGVPP
jgi:hypothetical protein